MISLRTEQHLRPFPSLFTAMSVRLLCIVLVALKLTNCMSISDQKIVSTQGTPAMVASTGTSPGPTSLSWKQNLQSEAMEMMNSVRSYNSTFRELLQDNFSCDNTSSGDCYCDFHCAFFGDCCIQYLNFSSGEPYHLKQKVSCQSLNRYFEDSRYLETSRGALTVEDCPEAAKGTIEDALCLQKVPDDDYSAALDIPVISYRTSLAYTNYYCALCNDDVDMLMNMNISIRCYYDYNADLSSFLDEDDAVNYDNYEFFENATYFRGEGRFLIQSNNSNDTQTCFVRIKEYDHIYSLISSGRVRGCYFEDLQTCDSSWPEYEDFLKCYAYSARIFNNSANVSYKNIHCAKCNFENISLLSFTAESLYAYGYPHDHPILILDVLFGFKSEPSEHCPVNNEVWDPFFKTCKQVVCGRGQSLMDGRCKTLLDFKNKSQDLTFINKSVEAKNHCIKRVLEDYVIFNNGSVYSPIRNEWFSKNEYEIYNDTVVLGCIKKFLYSQSFSPLQSYTAMAVFITSLISLVLHIIIYFHDLNHRTWNERNLLCLCFSLFVAQFLFLTAVRATRIYGFCLFVSVCLHYSWLASFCWMNILSFDIWKTFRSHFRFSRLNKSRQFLIYNVYAWGAPFVTVLIALLLDTTNVLPKLNPSYASKEVCWFNNKWGLLCFFLIPVGIIVVENMVLFISTSLSIHKQLKESKFCNKTPQSAGQDEKMNKADKPKIHLRRSTNKARKNRFSMCVKLGVLQGLTWTTAIVAVFISSPWWWYACTLLNGLQGVAIFVLFDLKISVLKSLKKKFNIAGGPRIFSSRRTYGVHKTEKMNSYVEKTQKTSEDDPESELSSKRIKRARFFSANRGEHLNESEITTRRKSFVTELTEESLDEDIRVQSTSLEEDRKTHESSSDTKETMEREVKEDRKLDGVEK